MVKTPRGERPQLKGRRSPGRRPVSAQRGRCSAHGPCACEAAPESQSISGNSPRLTFPVPPAPPPANGKHVSVSRLRIHVRVKAARRV
eukprot:4328643-Pyramimonas_sp.AAC.1